MVFIMEVFLFMGKGLWLKSVLIGVIFEDLSVLLVRVIVCRLF